MTEVPPVCGATVAVLAPADAMAGVTVPPPVPVSCELPPGHLEADGLLRHQGPLPTGQRFSWPVRITAVRVAEGGLVNLSELHAEPDPPEAFIPLTTDVDPAGARLIEDVPEGFRGRPLRHHAHPTPDVRRPAPSAARSGPTVLFRSVEWDGPPPLAGDIVVTTEGAYVVVDVAEGAGIGHYTIRARRARLIGWKGAPPSAD